MPIIDLFDTSHAIAQEVTTLLTSIVSTFQKNNPDRKYSVLYSHLHVLYYWKENNVQYIITENSAKPKMGMYPIKKGNIADYGILHIIDNEITYHFRP